MKYPRIAAALYAAPWQILPVKFQEIAAAFESARIAPGAQPEAAADDGVGPYDQDERGQRDYYHPQIQVRGHLAFATVSGVTGRRLSAMAMMCGGFDTGLFRQQLENIRQDPAIRTLVIEFDSPGGMAAGTAETAAAIRAVADSGKRVIGYASGHCCSAAYWMASACDELHADPSATVGSISTIMSGQDTSRQWEMEGRELKLFSTGKFKATGTPGKRWTEEEEANIWSIVRPLDAEFKGYVSARRQLTPDLMEGQWWIAKHAPAGVVDSTAFQDIDALLMSAYQL